MRGRLDHAWSPRRMRGTTPAHAGKTVCVTHAACSWSDHPRACGEDRWIHSGSSRCGGPPPRMRGRLSTLMSVLPFVGTTPAHAGKTASTLRQAPGPGDHPRACGEDEGYLRPATEGNGPPPRMRGRLRPTLSRIRRWRDHPRACGEDTTPQMQAAARWGPPPRMRGRPCALVLHDVAYRTTPAHAGKTGRRISARMSAGDHPRACGEDTR